MTPARSTLGIVLAVSVVGLSWPGTLLGQSQPKLPTPLPVPKTGSEAAVAKPAPAPPVVSQAAPAPVPGGGRDPFDPLVKKPEPGEERRFQQIAGLKLVGVVWDAKAPEQIRALVETPEGLGYYLRVNEEKFGGKVVSIERDRIQFSVHEDLPGGTKRERTVDLRLAKPVVQ
jgi:hypothetical protein